MSLFLSASLHSFSCGKFCGDTFLLPPPGLQHLVTNGAGYAKLILINDQTCLWLHGTWIMPVFLARCSPAAEWRVSLATNSTLQPMAPIQCLAHILPYKIFRLVQIWTPRQALHMRPHRLSSHDSIGAHDRVVIGIIAVLAFVTEGAELLLPAATAALGRQRRHVRHAAGGRCAPSKAGRDPHLSSEVHSYT